MCQDLVDEWVLVSEDEISYAVYKMLQEHSKVQHFFISNSRIKAVASNCAQGGGGGGLPGCICQKSW